MEIKYYESGRGNCEILDFIRSLSDSKHQKAIIETIDLLQNQELYNLIKIKIVEKISKNPPIYELKCHFGKNIYRILFGVKISVYLLVVIFNKKDQKIRRRYIDLAIKRFNNSQ